MATQFPAGTIVKATDLNAALVDVGVTVNFTPSASITASTYANINASSLAFTKGQSTTRLVIIVSFTAYAGSTGFTSFLQPEYGVLVDGTDYLVGFYNFNSSQDHRQLVGMAVITGLTSGAKTIQLRARIAGQGGTGGTMICDAGDRGSILCFEIPA